MGDTVLVSPSGRIESECVAHALSSAGLNAHAGFLAQPPVAHVVMALDGVSVEDERSRADALIGSPLPTLVLGQDLPIESLTSALASAIKSLIHDREHDGGCRPDHGNAPDVLELLSDRERQVLLLVADGCANETIATQLDISYHTVRTHLRNALAKLNVPHRHAAAVLVQRSRPSAGRPVVARARVRWST